MPPVTPPRRDRRYPDFPTIVNALAYAAAHIEFINALPRCRAPASARSTSAR
jgi:hypothetical protein